MGATIQEGFRRRSEICRIPVAVLEDVPGFIRGMVTSGIRRGIPPAEQDRFVTLFRGEADLKRFVAYSGQTKRISYCSIPRVRSSGADMDCFESKTTQPSRMQQNNWPCSDPLGLRVWVRHVLNVHRPLSVGFCVTPNWPAQLLRIGTLAKPDQDPKPVVPKTLVCGTRTRVLKKSLFNAGRHKTLQVLLRA
jgi:hypothetical protein